MKNSKDKDKMVVLDCLTKIQQAKPLHHSTLVNKELGPEVIIDFQSNRSQKIKNAICSVRPNSQIYKRISKQFLQNVKMGLDQTLIFCGLDTGARLETSVGLKSNPGVLMMCAICLLDEKYRENSLKFDVEVAFLEFNETNITDLLNYTGILTNKSEDKGSFGETFVKISTFKSFISLLKIAVFNNKDRDLNTSSKYPRLQNSTFVMKIRTSKYEGSILKSRQENVFIDLENGRQQKQKNGKTTWDYILIEVNNRNPLHKKIKYHLVEPNPLLLMVQWYLQKSQTTFIHSFPANPTLFHQHLRFNITLKTQIGNQFQQIFTPQISLNNQAKCEEIHQELKLIISLMKEKHYMSIRQLQQIKLQCKEAVNKCKDIMKESKRIIFEVITVLRKMKLVKNQNIGFAMQLVGSCVKSQHFKDFYCAKTYLSLQRQVNIKTHSVRAEFKQLSQKVQQLEEQFVFARKKHFQMINFFKTNYDGDIVRKVCKLLQTVMQMFHKIYRQVCLSQSRTIFDQILRQEEFHSHLGLIEQFLKDFTFALAEIGTKYPVSLYQSTILDNLPTKNLMKIYPRLTKLPQTKVPFTKLPLIKNEKINLKSLRVQNLLINPDLTLNPIEESINDK